MRSPKRSLARPSSGTAITPASPVTENATPPSVARLGCGPTISCTNRVTIGAIACTANCVSNSTRISGAMPGMRVIMRNDASIVVPLRFSFGGVNRSGTSHQHSAKAISEMPPATKKGCR